VRSFADLVDDLLADVRRAPVADLELEALSFAMALVWASVTPREDAQAVVDRLSASADPAAAAALRALALLGPPVLRQAAAGVPVDLSDRAGDVGRFDVVSAHRAVGPGLVAHVVWLSRPGGRAQSFFLISAADDLGAALLGGGMSGDSDPDGLEARLAQVAGALDVGEFRAVEPDEVLARLRRGATTNRALMAEVSVSLAMGIDLIAHALAGDVEAVPSLDWAEDDQEDDDARAAFLMRVLARALEDGVDPNDAEALAAWRDTFGALSPREQLRALGLPAAQAGPPHAEKRSDAGRRSKRKAARKARKRNR
jgi:hypothetical protein